ncbi:MAG: S4 domain-containing protein [Armatimonadetes bacterium]|nr:S4 domain-containing protein [Armatimonadota bacterium]
MSSGGKRKKRSPESGAEKPGQPEELRLDKFLKNVGIVPRRALAQEACQRGLILLDGRPAKPAAPVRPGQMLEVRLGMRVRRWRVRNVPSRPVARASRAECVELLAEEVLDLDEGA